MNKSLVTLLTFLFLNLTVSQSFALTPTTAPTGTLTPTTPPKTTEEPKSMGVLKDLKDQIASRVAQLNLVEKKGIIGIIQSISGTQITITDVNNQQRFIDVDELTKFSSPDVKTSFGLSDLSKGTVIDVLGLYNKQTKHTLARFINVVTPPQFLQGEIASIDGTGFVITVISDKGILTPVDVENITKTFLHSKEDGLQKAGFSKIETGKQIVVIGFPDKKNPKRILASRILVFPEVAKNPRIIIPQQAINPDDQVIPSTGSGKKLTPITR
jgi:hypothetical protein